jgi:hypothetical protein
MSSRPTIPLPLRLGITRDAAGKVTGPHPDVRL